MFKPNAYCYIVRTSTDTDVYGMPLNSTKTKEPCTPLRVDAQVDRSSVRADTSASRGNAREFQTEAKFLVPKNTVARIDDILEWQGDAMRIAGKMPRYNLQGVLDHYELSCTDWNNFT